MKSDTKSSYLTHHAWSSESKQLALAADQRKTPPCAAVPPSHQALPAEAPADNTRTVLNATHTILLVKSSTGHLGTSAFQPCSTPCWRAVAAQVLVLRSGVSREWMPPQVCSQRYLSISTSQQAVQALLTGKKQGMLTRRGPHCSPLGLPPLQQRSQHPGRPENCMRPHRQTSPPSRGFPETQGLRHTNTFHQHVAWIGAFVRRRVLFI